MNDDFEQRLCTSYRERSQTIKAAPEVTKRLQAVFRLLLQYPVPAAAGDYLLVVRKGETAYWFRMPDHEMKSGRRLDNDLVLDHPWVSGCHFSIQPSQPYPLVVDCKSTNGVFVNGERRQEHHLHEGDAIQLGPFLIVYARSGHAAE